VDADRCATRARAPGVGEASRTAFPATPALCPVCLPAQRAPVGREMYLQGDGGSSSPSSSLSAAGRERAG
jgi:hypothetical protein